MKKFLCFLFILIIIASLLIPLFGCRSCTTDISSLDENPYSNAIIVYKDSGIMLLNIVDLEYNNETKNIQYIRKTETGRYIKGIVPYDKIEIFTVNGRLYNKNNEWYYKDNNTHKSYLINNDKYCDIVISKNNIEE